MYWLVVYLLTAVIAASVVFVWGDWVRAGDQPAPPRPGWAALLAGLMWPILMVGVVQLSAVLVLARLIARDHHPAGAVTPVDRPTTPLIL